VVLVNGWREVWQIPFRWPLGIFINIVASFRALHQFQRWIYAKEPLRWVKTSHVLPENFGLEPQLSEATEEVTRAIES
jgi:hypothetical protein